MNAPSHPEKPEQPLIIEGIDYDGPERACHMMVHFNRAPTEVELRMYRELPTTPVMFADAKAYVERMMLAELVVRLFRFFVLGQIVLPDTPMVMDWLKSFIDGNGHGPLGSGPLRWPRTCPTAVNVLTRWGYEATPTEPPYVVKSRAPTKSGGQG